jgi:uncharacterized protein YneF (UPF0154 family)
MSIGYLLHGFGPAFESEISLALYTALAAFVGALIGSWIARSYFLLPVVSLWAATWVYVVYVLYMIAEPVIGDDALVGILQHNWLSIILSAGALVAGWALGRSFARQRAPVSAA